jgi:hypothetical protein
VIEGAMKTIKRDTPLLFFEIHGLTKESKYNDFIKIFDAITPIGYNIYNSNYKEAIALDSLNEFYKGAFIAYHRDDNRFKNILSQTA